MKAIRQQPVPDWDDRGNFNGFSTSGCRNHFLPHAICRLILERPDLLEFETHPAGPCRTERPDRDRHAPL